jgi:hypothetical protein
MATKSKMALERKHGPKPALGHVPVNGPNWFIFIYNFFEQWTTHASLFQGYFARK